MGGHADEGRSRFGRQRGTVGDAVIAAMTGMAMCFGYLPAPDGPAAPAGPAAGRPRAWRDDQAFADIVEPLAGDLRWRLRVLRLLLRTTVRPALRVAAAAGGFAAVVGVTAAGLLFLGASLADAYGAAVRWALRPFA